MADSFSNLYGVNVASTEEAISSTKVAMRAVASNPNLSEKSKAELLDLMMQQEGKLQQLHDGYVYDKRWVDESHFDAQLTAAIAPLYQPQSVSESPPLQSISPSPPHSPPHYGQSAAGQQFTQVLFTKATKPMDPVQEACNLLNTLEQLRKSNITLTPNMDYGTGFEVTATIDVRKVPLALRTSYRDANRLLRAHFQKMEDDDRSSRVQSTTIRQKF